jgi:SAM-dependent methyltransferase
MPETLVRTSFLRTEDGRILELDVRRWMAPADPVDESLLDRARGAVLDVGCGPGRHVQSLMRRGIPALGIDTSPSAVALARRRGANVDECSIFDEVPAVGTWGSALLLDGSIGIGGDPEALLKRVGQVVAARARLLVETGHPNEPTETLDVCVETATKSGPWFRWSLVSHVDMGRLARTSGFRLTSAWEKDDRYFAQLDR